MIRLGATISLMILTLIFSGCGGEPPMSKVHEGPLLDDKVLQDRVELALNNAGPDFKNVHVKADSGTIFLTGNVSSTDAWAKAQDISRNVYGVKQTVNELGVGTPATAH